MLRVFLIRSVEGALSMSPSTECSSESLLSEGVSIPAHIRFSTMSSSENAPGGEVGLSGRRSLPSTCPGGVDGRGFVMERSGISLKASICSDGSDARTVSPGGDVTLRAPVCHLGTLFDNASSSALFEGCGSASGSESDYSSEILPRPSSSGRQISFNVHFLAGPDTCLNFLRAVINGGASGSST